MDIDQVFIDAYNEMTPGQKEVLRTIYENNKNLITEIDQRFRMTTTIEQETLITLVVKILEKGIFSDG